MLYITKGELSNLSVKPRRIDTAVLGVLDFVEELFHACIVVKIVRIAVHPYPIKIGMYFLYVGECRLL